MMRKIINLTKIFCKEYFLNLPIKNKKNIIYWLIIIINIILIFLSQKCISFLGNLGQEELFLQIFFIIFNILIMSQTILSCTNIYYFSKDIENIISFPIKPIELLIAKFNTLLSISYLTEILFCVIPLLVYGLMINKNIFYFIWLIIILIIFPIFITILISILMLIITKIFQFIKNKDKFQIITTIILLLFFSIFQIYAFKNIYNNNIINNNNGQQIETQVNNNEEIQHNKIHEIKNEIKEVNKYFLIINYSIDILNESNNLNCVINFIKIIFIELIFFIIFILIGNKIYFNNLINSISKSNIKKNKYRKNKYKKTNKNKKYIIEEIKNLINNPTFLIQCIFPTIIVGILIGGLVIILFPTIMDMIKYETQMQEIKIEFNFEIMMVILGIIQLIFIFSNISLTAITRKGKNAKFIKYIPIDFYKQFLLLNIPQILFNNISIIIILIIMKYCIPTINIFNILLLFVLANLLNIINSFIMLIVDFKRPNLNWDNETSAIKENTNKLFQYVLTIFIIALLIYFNKIFSEINFNLASILTIIIFTLIIILINLYVKKNIKKIYEKII